MKNLKGQVEFKDVTFRYAQIRRRLLRMLALEQKLVKQWPSLGQRVQVNQLWSIWFHVFYDVSAGEILVDGVNVQDYNLKDLRNKVGYIPQKAVLFSGDVKGNLDFGQSQETPT